MSVKLIAVDLDGTLLAHEGQVGERNGAALRTAQASGVEVVIATGRRHCYAMKVLREVGLAPETMLVSSNGAVVRTMGDAHLLDRTVMPTEVARRICGALGEFRNALVVTFDNVQADGQDSCGALVVEDLADLHGSIGRWMEVNGPYIQRVTPIERALEGDAPIQMMVCGTVERMRRAEALLLCLEGVSGVDEDAGGASVTLHRTEYPERDLSLVDILPGGVSKGAALRKLLNRLGLRAEDMMAMGDNWNDLSMLEVAGWPVLMANAPHDLKELAAAKGWRVARRHDDDGVAKVVEELISVGLRPIDGEMVGSGRGEMRG